MADDDVAPASPPLPKKGTYNFDFDALNETSNPFETKVKIGAPSPNRSSPATSRTNHDRLADPDIVEDPFKPKKMLASSPPLSPQPDNSMVRKQLSGSLVDSSGEGQQPAETRKKRTLKKPAKVQSRSRASTKDWEQGAPSPRESLAAPADFSDDQLQDDSQRQPLVQTSRAGQGHQSEGLGDFTDSKLRDGLTRQEPKEPFSRINSFPDAGKQNRSLEDEKAGASSSNSSSKTLSGGISNNTLVGETSLKVQENKNESSSEEAQFYDAFDHPPVDRTKAKLGQKPSAEMERGSCHDEGGDSKGAVVQLVQVLRYSQSDWNKLKQDMELSLQTTLLNKERDWSMLLAERDARLAACEETNRKLKHTNEEMRMIVAEFEKTISQLQADKEKSKTESQKIVHNLESERDQAVEDLQSVEAAFSDLHRRYEKSKSIIEGFKRNEEQLKQCVEDLQTKLKKSDQKLQALRCQAEEKLDKANEDIDKIKKSSKTDLVRLEATLKKAELKISTLEESLQRKDKENKELTALCEDLIGKVGSP